MYKRNELIDILELKFTHKYQSYAHKKKTGRTYQSIACDAFKTKEFKTL